MASRRVLIVDDEPMIRMALQDVLEAQGFSVEEAEDAGQALHLLDKLPDTELMVTDVKMPGMDGLDLAAEATARRPDLRIVIISGHADAHDSRIPDSAVFMRKPFPFAAFAEWLWSGVSQDGGFPR